MVSDEHLDAQAAALWTRRLRVQEASAVRVPRLLVLCLQTALSGLWVTDNCVSHGMSEESQHMGGYPTTWWCHVSVQTLQPLQTHPEALVRGDRAAFRS